MIPVDSKHGQCYVSLRSDWLGHFVDVYVERPPVWWWPFKRYERVWSHDTTLNTDSLNGEQQRSIAAKVVAEYDQWKSAQQAHPPLDAAGPTSTVPVVVGVMLVAAIAAYMLIRTPAVSTPPPPPPVEVGTRVHRFVLVSIDPPKHVYATLRDVATGAAYERVYVSKHCNAWRDNEIGAEYNLSVKVWQRADGTQYYSFNNLYSALCSGETK